MNKVKEEKKLDANFTAGGILYQEFSGLMDIVESKNFNDLISAETENNAFIGNAGHSIPPSPGQSEHSWPVKVSHPRRTKVNHFWI